MEVRRVNPAEWRLIRPERSVIPEEKEVSFPGKGPVKEISSGSGKADLRELLEIARLRQIDRMVRAHEQAHLAAGGDLVISGPHYVYRVGPDGKRYAVAGDVRLDTSPVPGDPEATLRKAERIVRAALAPVNPSPQDLRVAMRARMMAQQARMELQEQRLREMKEGGGENSPRRLAVDNGFSGSFGINRSYGG